MLREGSDLPEAAVGTKPLPDSKSSASPTKLHGAQAVSKEGARPSLHVFSGDPRWGLSNTLSKPLPCPVSPPHQSPTFSAPTVHPPQFTGNTQA